MENLTFSPNVTNNMHLSTPAISRQHKETRSLVWQA